MDRLVLTPAARRDAVLQFMRSANHRLVLSMFRCDDFSIVDEVAAAVKRNVQVRVLITHRARGWKQRLKELGALLESTGAEVLRYDGPLLKYHAKYVVADDANALVSSLNFTHKCFDSTCDFLVFSDAPEVVSGLNTVFENDSTRPGTPLPDITDRLIVGPDHARERIARLLTEAQTSIRIIDHRVLDPQMITLLHARQAEGVSVQMPGDGAMHGLIPHGRMILVDNRVAVIGSIHLSPPSLNSRREVAILTREPAILSELNEFFESLCAPAFFKLNLSEIETRIPVVRYEDEEDDEDYSAVQV